MYEYGQVISYFICLVLEGILVTVYVRDRNDLCQFVPCTRDAGV